ARAMGHERQILVFDEPTAALSSAESERLFHLIRRLRERGVAIVYISHRLEEVFDIADRVTVLRDGNLVRTGLMTEMSHSDVVEAMVGREVQRFEREPVTLTDTEAFRFTFEDVLLKPGELEIRP